MIIDQLPLLGGDVQGTDEFPIERGTTTYKTTQAALIKTATDAAAAAQAAADDAQDTADEANAKGLPPGGTAGQVLTKAGSADYSASWQNPSGGGTNRNLLDNWYFIGGGSQIGYGTFPINQRGQASYSNANAYTIDRWKLTSGSMSVVSGGITLNGTLAQILKNAIGQAVVCSALLSDGTMITPTYDDSTKTFTLTATGQTIVAAKLELGSEQTLAHQENGSWVLNEIPDYGDELAKCQRYYRRMVASSAYSDIAFGVVQNGTTAVFYVDTSEMVSYPPISMEGNIRVTVYTPSGIVTSGNISSIRLGSSLPRFYKITATGTFSSNMIGHPATLSANNDTTAALIMDANL